MCRFRWLSLLAVTGFVGLWLAVASTLARAADEQSQKARDIQWFLDKASRAAATIENDSRKGEALRAIAAAQAASGDFSSALATAAGIRDPIGRVRAHCLVANAQAKTGNAVGANEAIELAKQAAAVYKEGWVNPWIHAEIADAQARAGDFAGALRKVREIEQAWAKNLAYAYIAEAQARTGEVKQVRAWAETLTEPREVVSACLGAVKGLQGEEDESGE